jgi:hypothetical protein
MGFSNWWSRITFWRLSCSKWPRKLQRLTGDCGKSTLRASSPTPRPGFFARFKQREGEAGKTVQAKRCDHRDVRGVAASAQIDQASMAPRAKKAAAASAGAN